jgi:L-ascorbate metabolism protein UlaG (beta-lactamase superfamily)
MIILIAIFIFIVVVYAFLNLYPDFGGRATKEKLQVYSNLSYFQKNRFINEVHTSMDMSVRSMISILIDYLKGNPRSKPNKEIPIESYKLSNHHPKITWFGHSTILLEIDGKRLLIDPMFGKAPSPFPWLGLGRFSKKLPIELDNLTSIDAVIISHDHYDHLDYYSIKKLKTKTTNFFVPLGVGNHLERWDVDSENISEHGWWEEISFGDLKLVCTPSRHFSGRSLTDRDATLWCSWTILGKNKSIYFSGDTGYGPHFKEIGEKYGPFDITLLECGQYDCRWSEIHMMPEQTVEAHIDLKGKLLIPIHWSAFILSLHDWNDPVKRVTNAANRMNQFISTPKIGKPVFLGTESYPDTTWWD